MRAVETFNAAGKVMEYYKRVTAAVAGVGYDFSSTRYGFFFTRYGFFFTPVVRRSADKGTWRAAARQGHSLMQRNNIRMLSLLEFEPQQTEQLHFRRLAKSNMQHEKIGRFVSGGAYEGKQNTSGEQPDVLVSLRKAPSA